MHKPLILLALVFTLLSAHANSLASPQGMTPIDMTELTRLSNPRLSPDGRYMIYLRSEVNWKKNKQVLRYRLVDIETGVVTPLVEPEKKTESFGSIYWSPDSSQFLTLRKRKDDDHRQAYVYKMSDGSFTRLTDHGANVGNPRWQPDSKGFYFSSTRQRSKRDQALRKKKWVIREYESREPGEIWHYDLATETSKIVVQGNFFVRGYSLSRDGNSLLYQRTQHGLIDRPEAELWQYNVLTNQQSQLTDNQFQERRAKFSPDNKSFAFIASVNQRGEQYYENNLFVQTVGAENRQLLLPKVAMEVMDFSWDASGEGLYLIGNTGLRQDIYHYTLDDRKLTAITQGDHAINHWQYHWHSNTHSYLRYNANDPGEVFVQRDTHVQQLSNEYNDLKKNFLLPSQVAYTWKGRKRTQVEGLLVYPIGHDPATRPEKPFPLVTISHGGPRSSAQFGAWNISRYVPVLTAQGYAVFLPNYRGSSGYGDKFLRDMVGNYFRNSHRDVLDGIDALIKDGIADPNRLVKMGWSAGGHMTNKLITVTDQFAVAASGAGVADWISMYGESDVRHNREPWLGGSPWEKRAPLRAFQRQSPLKDTWKVTTPTLFWNGGSDARVPPTQGIMMYRGVKAAGTDTELYLAPREPHNFKVPGHRLFKINTELAWYAKHIDGIEFTPGFPSELEDALNDDDDKSDEANNETE